MKKIFFILGLIYAAILVLGFYNTANAVNNFSDAEAIWYMEEASGNRADSSGNGNTLVDNGTVDQNTTEFKQGSASADFQGSIPEYFNITDGNLSANFPLKSGDTTPIFSVAGWMRYTSTPSFSPLFAKWGVSTNHSVLLGINGNDVVLLQGYATSLQDTLVNNNNDAPVNTWIHICYSYNDSTKAWLVRTYNDSTGAATYSGTWARAGIFIGTADVTIGAYGTGTGALTGQTDEIPVWDGVQLTADDCDAVRNGTYGAGSTTTTTQAPTTTTTTLAPTTTTTTLAPTTTTTTLAPTTTTTTQPVTTTTAPTTTTTQPVTTTTAPTTTTTTTPTTTSTTVPTTTTTSPPTTTTTTLPPLLLSDIVFNIEGSPTQYQWPIYNDDTQLGAVTVTGSKTVCTDANGSPTACSTITIAESMPFNFSAPPPDGNNCAAPTAVLFNSGSREYSVVCADSDSSRFDISAPLPGWDGTPITVTLIYMQTASEADKYVNADIDCQARGQGEATNSTYSSPAVEINSAQSSTAYANNFVTSGSISPDCTTSCQAGDKLSCRVIIDSTSSTATMASVHFIDGVINYTRVLTVQ